MTSDTGFTLDDILNNDFETVLAVVGSQSDVGAEKVEEVVSLGNFVKKL